MSKHPTLLEHFRSFCYQNSATDLETAIAYFSVFGGMGWRVDMRKSIETLIEEKVLPNYRYMHADITLITQSNPVYHSLLTAIALGDRREHSSFKRANLSREKGEDAIDFLVEKGLLRIDTSIEKPIDGKDDNSDKLLFEQPFMRFWFAAISPYYKGIKEGDYSEVKAHWQERKQAFGNLVYTQLVMAFLKESFTGEEAITQIGAYWDRNVEIDILAKTRGGKLVAGLCKYSKSKANKSDLTKLKAACQKAELEVDTFVLFSKNKFSSELKKEKGTKLKLLSARNMVGLMGDLKASDLLTYSHKKY